MAFAIDDIDDGFDLTDDFQMNTKIMVFGVGGAGGNAAAHMVDSGVLDVEYVIANTDVAALRKKDGSKMKRIQIGRKTTRGQGAGNDPQKGQASAEENRDDIASVLDGVSMLLLQQVWAAALVQARLPLWLLLPRKRVYLLLALLPSLSIGRARQKCRWLSAEFPR